jgi:hypothetical protein
VILYVGWLLASLLTLAMSTFNLVSYYIAYLDTKSEAAAFMTVSAILTLSGSLYHGYRCATHVFGSSQDTSGVLEALSAIEMGIVLIVAIFQTGLMVGWFRRNHRRRRR